MTDRTRVDPGPQLRVSGYILHFLATDERFYNAFRDAVREVRERNPNLRDQGAFQTVLDATRAAMYNDPNLMEPKKESNVPLSSQNIGGDLNEVKTFLRHRVAHDVINNLPFNIASDGINHFLRTGNRGGLVPREGHGIQPPYDTLEQFVTPDRRSGITRLREQPLSRPPTTASADNPTANLPRECLSEIDNITAEFRKINQNRGAQQTFANQLRQSLRDPNTKFEDAVLTAFNEANGGSRYVRNKSAGNSTTDVNFSQANELLNKFRANQGRDQNCR